MKIYNATLHFEFVRECESVKCDSPSKIADYMADAYAQNPTQESLWVICLDQKNQPKGRTMVTLGTANASLIHPREVFKPAILCGATSIIVSHNHPSGDPSPSGADIAATRKLREAAIILDIALLDHVIVGDKSSDPCGKGHYSFREAGLV